MRVEPISKGSRDMRCRTTNKKSGVIARGRSSYQHTTSGQIRKKEYTSAQLRISLSDFFLIW